MNERVRLSLGFALLAVLFVALAVVYPFLVEDALVRFGVRPVALGTAVAAGLGYLLRLRFQGEIPGFARGQPLGRGQVLGVIALVGAAAITNERRWLLFLPALAYFYVAWTFWMSLGDSVSIFERAARVIQPYAPSFIGPYCRKATVLWTALFFANAIVVAALAWGATAEAWAAYTGRGAFILMAVVGIGEWMFRKWWFRHYGDHLLDRVLRRVMPPENTARGRRSSAFIRDMRARLAAEREQPR